MNCADTSPLLHAYADGELDLVRSLDVEQHLKTCAACDATRRSLQSLRSALRRSDLAYRAPQTLRTQVRRIVGNAHRESQPRRGAQKFWQWLALGATAFAVITFVLRPAGISENDRLADEAIASHVRSLMPGHLTDVVSSDQHTVKPWFNGKIDFAPEVKDFADRGFPLVGGRLDYLNGQTVAVLVYHRNKHLINVFIWPAKKPHADQAENRRGYSIITRDINGLRYYIISDLNAEELTRFAKLLKE